MAARTSHTERVCPTCGATFRRHAGKSTGQCLDCASKTFESVARQSKDKKGPVYEKVVRGQLAYWSAEATRLNLGE